MTDKSSPRRVEAAPFEPPSPDNQPNPVLSQQKWPYFALAVLVLIAVPAIFKLVDLLGSGADTQVIYASETAAQQESLETDATAPPDSPFEDALLAEARADSQDILSVLLPLRRSLEEKRAGEWAEESFEDLVALALEGDELYQARDFESSQLKYQESLLLAQEIDEQIASVAESLRQEAYEALQARNEPLALDRFELAVAVEPEDESAQIGLARAKALSEVTALLNSADILIEQSQFEQAKIEVEQAIALDNEDPLSKEVLASIESSIARRDFQEYMSVGYRELSASNYDQAQSAFRSARLIDPQNNAVADALDQVEATRESDRSAGLLQQALLAEQTEQWTTARDQYQLLLEEDPNRVEARIALVKVEARVNLETEILEYIGQPLRLKDEQLWRKAEEALRQARAISSPGPVLNNQADQLAQTLRKARTPVRLELVSDGATQISILGVSNLGLIRTHPLDLNPGTYVVIGKKSGFQDIRQEVVLTGDEAKVVVSLIPSRSLESF